MSVRCSEIVIYPNWWSVLRNDPSSFMMLSVIKWSEFLIMLNVGERPKTLMMLGVREQPKTLIILSVENDLRLWWCSMFENDPRLVPLSFIMMRSFSWLFILKSLDVEIFEFWIAMLLVLEKLSVEEIFGMLHLWPLS